MSDLTSSLIFIQEYLLLICSLCPAGVQLADIKTHYQKTHQATKAQREAVFTKAEEYVVSAPSYNIQVLYKIPEQVPVLPVYLDGIQCIYGAC